MKYLTNVWTSVRNILLNFCCHGRCVNILSRWQYDGRSSTYIHNSADNSGAGLKFHPWISTLHAVIITMHEELTNICMGGHLRVWEEGFQQICHPYRVTWVASLFCFPSNTAWRCSIHPPSPWDLKLTYSHKWAKPFWWAKNMISYSNLQCSNWKVSFDPNVVCNSMYTFIGHLFVQTVCPQEKKVFSWSPAMFKPWKLSSLSCPGNAT